jgi:hypothetical protein
MGCSLLHFSTAALVSSYLFPRHQRVGCGDNFSSLTPLVAGVLQASLISPLYFSLFIDDMTNVLQMIYKFTTAIRGICSPPDSRSVFIYLFIYFAFVNGLMSN